jgi:oxygen-independent coproporphyrinogen-3 oxidase
MRTDLSSKYDLRVPRYTSYPTAPHFSESVDGTQYRQWLGEFDRDMDLSLYFHIPFCAEMCWFCGCYTKVVKRYEPVQQYLETLLQEIDVVADALPARFKVRHLHWGGGSPTMLKGADWLRIFEKLRGRFDIDADEEIAVELDPRTATEDYVKALADAGVNRASIGVQDFHGEVQKAINRVQPFEITERVVGLLRKHGIDHINMDLLYGLPHQNTERVREMVDLAAQLKPARVALFGYAHVPWMKTHQKMIDETALPDAEERWQQFNAASLRMVERGYVPIGLDHFALPDDKLAVALREGRLHRNFQGYTVDAAGSLLGFGASAIGSLPQGYIQNLSPLKPYRETVAAGKLPVARGVAYSDDDRLRGEIIERLMCDLRVDVDAINRRHGTASDTFDPEMENLAKLADDGIIDLDGSRIAVTEDGRPYVRVVAAVFDRYLQSGKGRHSRAV